MLLSIVSDLTTSQSLSTVQMTTANKRRFRETNTPDTFAEMRLHWIVGKRLHTIE